MFSREGLRPLYDYNLDAGAGGGGERSLVQETQESVWKITPQSVLPLRLFTASSAFLPLMILASSDIGETSPSLEAKLEQLQALGSQDEGWHLLPGRIYDLLRNLDKNGLLQRSEDKLILSPDIASVIAAAGGNFVEAMENLWDNGFGVSPQDVWGKTNYEAESGQDAVFVRAKIFMALAKYYSAPNRKVNLSIDNLAKIVDLPLESLRAHIITLSKEFDLVTYVVPEKRTYTVLNQVDPATFHPSTKKREESDVSTVYKAIQTLLPDSFAEENTFSLQLTSRAIRLVIQKENPEAPVLRHLPSGGDRVSHALGVLTSMGILRPENETTVSLTPQQLEVISPFAILLEGLSDGSEQFITEGKARLDGFLADSNSQDLLSFMTSLKEFSNRKSAAEFMERRNAVMKFLIESGDFISSNVLAENFGRTLKYFRDVVLRRLRKQALVVSRSLPSTTHEFAWKFSPFSTIDRLLTEGGFVFIDRPYLTGQDVSQCIIPAMGEDDTAQFLASLPQEWQEKINDVQLATGSTPVLDLSIGRLPNGNFRSLFIIKPQALIIYKNDEKNPTMLDSNAIGKFPVLIKGLQSYIEAFCKRKDISFVDFSTVIRNGLVNYFLKRAQYRSTYQIYVAGGTSTLFRKNTGIPIGEKTTGTREELLFQEEIPDDSEE